MTLATFALITSIICLYFGLASMEIRTYSYLHKITKSTCNHCRTWAAKRVLRCKRGLGSKRDQSVPPVKSLSKNLCLQRSKYGEFVWKTDVLSKRPSFISWLSERLFLRQTWCRYTMADRNRLKRLNCWGRNTFL